MKTFKNLKRKYFRLSPYCIPKKFYNRKMESGKTGKTTKKIETGSLDQNKMTE